MELKKTQEDFEIGFYVLKEGKMYFSFSEPEINLFTELDIVNPDELLLFYSLRSMLEVGSYLGEYDRVFWEGLQPVYLA